MKLEKKDIRVYTLPEIEEQTGISILNLRDFIKKGDLKASKIGRQYYITEDMFIEFVNSCIENPKHAYKPKK